MLFLQVFQPAKGNCPRQGSTSRCNSNHWWNYSSWFVGKYQFNVLLLLCVLFPVIFYYNPFRCTPRENVPCFDNILCKKILKQICIIERKPYPNHLPIFCSTMSSRDVVKSIDSESSLENFLKILRVCVKIIQGWEFQRTWTDD